MASCKHIVDFFTSLRIAIQLQTQLHTSTLHQFNLSNNLAHIIVTTLTTTCHPLLRLVRLVLIGLSAPLSTTSHGHAIAVRLFLLLGQHRQAGRLAARWATTRMNFPIFIGRNISDRSVSISALASIDISFQMYDASRMQSPSCQRFLFSFPADSVVFISRLSVLSVPFPSSGVF